MNAAWARGSLLFLCACLLYGNTLDHGFHYDDFHSVVHNPHIRSLGNIPAFFTDPTTFSVDPKQAMYRPVLLFSYALNYAWGGDDPTGYHVVNGLLHGVNAVLVSLLFSFLLGDLRLGFWIGLFFAATPLNAEAVNYISSRSELLMASFYLGTCVCYVRYGKTGNWPWFAVAVGLGVLALLTKAVAVTLVGTLLLCDWYAGGRERVVRSWKGYLVFSGLATLYMLASRQLVGKAFTEPVRSLDTQLWTQIKAAVYYLQLVVMPVRLSVEHQFFPSRSPVEGPVIGAGLLLASLLFLLFRSRAKLPKLASGWGVILLTPTAAVPLIVLVNEHRLYLASLGLSLLLAWGMGRIFKGRRGVAWYLVGVYTIILACITFQRSQVWADELSLWRDAAIKGPLMLKPHLRLGDALSERGRFDQAEKAYRRAVVLRPGHPGARNNLGTLYRKQKRFEEAEAEFRQLLQTSPDVIPTRLNLASLLLQRGDWEGARGEYLRALEFDHTQGKAQTNLGNIALQFERDPALALGYFDRALEVNPGSGKGIWGGRGVALKALGRFEEAEIAYLRALEMDPGYAEVWFNLGNLYRESGRMEAAVEAYEQVVASNPDSPLSSLALKRIATIVNQR
jgi:protein O-mannosyl-transferase